MKVRTDQRRLVRIMYIGMALTAALMLAPIIDMATADSISGHVRGVYPHWSAHKIHEDRDAIVAWLALAGVLGLGVWYWAIRAVRRHSRHARLVVTSAFTMGVVAVLINLSVGGNGYRQVVPLSYGLLSLVPAAVGLLAVVRAWKSPVAVRPVDVWHIPVRDG